MIRKINISGEWGFTPDEAMNGCGESFSYASPADTITLPSTTSLSGKGKDNPRKELSFLTDIHKYEGNAWYYKEVEVGELESGASAELFLERTRLTELWVNGTYAGSRDSLCTPHRYDITPYIKNGTARLCIKVCNTGYPTKGGHMTSPDTQSNWNGITGELSLRLYDKLCIRDVQAYPDVDNGTVTLRFRLCGADKAEISVWGASSDQKMIDRRTFSVRASEPEIVMPLGGDISLWSEHTPVTYTLKLVCEGSPDTATVTFGMRKIETRGLGLYLNGSRIFLRGKHDGMVFPLTGAAPTTVEEWSKVLSIAKQWGINHYRFHTCCPPDAAFTAADILGIYMQPELPFWGTVHDPDDEEYSEVEQKYLISEGKRMLKEFGSHPSFVMMSLGNELWGSEKRLNEILGEYRTLDSRHLYTQGSNNFQFYPMLLPNDDFFSGVRLSRDRLIRGSYAACDKPFGFVQTDEPNTVHSYDRLIIPQNSSDTSCSDGEDIEIQYGTGVKKVHVQEGEHSLVPDRPVITHEVGQYCSYPDFGEIEKYTGPLRPYYLETFEKRLEKNGMAAQAEMMHMASGLLAFNCYKLEIEAAMRSEHISGFQLLDLQDFPGQCVALVGMLDPLMEEKRFTAKYDLREKWLGFCSDIVILAELESFVTAVGETLSIPVWIRNMSGGPLEGKRLCWSTNEEQESIDIPDGLTGLVKLCDISFTITYAGCINLDFSIIDREGTLADKPYACNEYYIWSYRRPEKIIIPEGVFEEDSRRVHMTSDAEKARSLLSRGERVLYLPAELKSSIPGTYCTDFWCYPMFRSISESMGREVPAGTLGLLIDSEHPALCGFESRFYSTPQWYNIVTHSSCAVLDEAPPEYRQIVQVIDNFERSHKLGMLFEAKYGSGRLMVCTGRLSEITERPEVQTFIRSILRYMLSDSFEPETELPDELTGL